jgi:Flp pilus assembly protein TadD
VRGALPRSARILPSASACAIAVALLLCALSRHQAGAYRDSTTLWRRTLAVNPASWMAWNNLGLEEFGRGDTAAARRSFSTAVGLNPSDGTLHFNLGAALAAGGRLEAAAEEYRRGLSLRPGEAAAHLQLGVILDRMGRPGEALPHYRAAKERGAGPRGGSR